METLGEIMDTTNLYLSEAESIAQCIHNTIECNILTNDDCTNLLVLSKMSLQRLNILQEKFSILEEKIYKQILLK